MNQESQTTEEPIISGVAKDPQVSEEDLKTATEEAANAALLHHKHVASKAVRDAHLFMLDDTEFERSVYTVQYLEYVAFRTWERQVVEGTDTDDTQMPVMPYTAARAEAQGIEQFELLQNIGA